MQALFNVILMTFFIVSLTWLLSTDEVEYKYSPNETRIARNILVFKRGVNQYVSSLPLNEQGQTAKDSFILDFDDVMRTACNIQTPGPVPGGVDQDERDAAQFFRNDCMITGYTDTIRPDLTKADVDIHASYVNNAGDRRKHLYVYTGTSLCKSGTNMSRVYNELVKMTKSSMTMHLAENPADLPFVNDLERPADGALDTSCSIVYSAVILDH